MPMVIFGCFAESFDQTVCKIQEMSSEIQSQVIQGCRKFFRRVNSLKFHCGSNLQISLVLRRKHVDVGGLYDRPAVGPQVCNALLLVQGKE